VSFRVLAHRLYGWLLALVVFGALAPQRSQAQVDCGYAPSARGSIRLPGRQLSSSGCTSRAMHDLSEEVSISTVRRTSLSAWFALWIFNTITAKWGTT
jgi:hypothetical protein